MAIPVPEKRVARFENLGFGMFIHWGPRWKRASGS